MRSDLFVCDVLEGLSRLGDNSIDCCVTSPPYWGMRDYGVEGQLGLEATPKGYVCRMVGVFEEVRRVLKPTGTLRLNLGDTYCSDAKWGGESGNKNYTSAAGGYSRARKFSGAKPKDLLGMPWRVAFALQEAGWYLRSDIIWSKPNPMPESVRDRPTKAHEYVFLLTKSERYHYDAEAIKELAAYGEPNSPDSIQSPGGQGFTRRATAKESFRRDASKRAIAHPGHSMGTHRPDRKDTFANGLRNKRTVWTIATTPYPEAHFATFPEELPHPCILAGCPEGGVVLDPFAGSGTTLAVALKLGRGYVGIELNPEYAELINRRLANTTPNLFAEVS